MRRALRALARILIGLPLALISPVLLIVAAVALACCDLIARLRPRKPLPADTQPDTLAASIVIPNWNGRDLLEKYLPSVIAAAAQRNGSEVIVVDNGSSDGSAELLLERYPQVRLIALDENLGFGGGSNRGFEHARNDIVVLLNSDMRVERDFLGPLLEGFTDEKVFAVSCQIIFRTPPSSAKKPVSPRLGGAMEACAYAIASSLPSPPRIRVSTEAEAPAPSTGGKFAELGGFDPLLSPFYLEDTDLGYLAWKRGWKVLYAPASVVYHEHRGTIGKRFSPAYIQSVLKKNFLLFTWKNIHEWRKLGSHFCFAWAGSMLSWLFGDSPERASFPGIARAVLQLPRALISRARAHRLAALSDTEAFRRPLGGHFRDAFANDIGAAETLRVLFVSPYPICPPVHGGAVFMYQTVRELARLTDLHLIILLDFPHEQKAHQELEQICTSVEYIVRLEGRQKAIGSIEPHAVREFRNPDLAWLIHRQIYTHHIDVLQLEYTVLGQYAGEYRHIPSILFEHDIYFQSIARRLPFIGNTIERVQARWEYLRSLRYELRMLPHLDRVQVCSRENANYLVSFLPQLKGRVDTDLRAGISARDYAFEAGAREPFTMLFLGSFRHLPNQQALEWFVRKVLPRIREKEPRARLIVIGSDPPPRHSLPEAEAGAIDLIGFVDDIRQPLARYSVFVCPILSGSGVRVKLLEAFASGIPVVSTRLGAEGLASKDGEICALADHPQDFADRVVELLRDPAKAEQMAARARAEIVEHRDTKAMTQKMIATYRAELNRMSAGRRA